MDSVGTASEWKHQWSGTYSRHRFAVLLFLLVSLLIGTPLLTELGLPVEWFDGLMAFLMLAIVISVCFGRHERLFALVFGIPTIVLTGIAHAGSGRGSFWILLFAHLSEVFFLFGVAALIVKSLFTSPSLSFDRICGAICGYLFLGLGWAVIYVTIDAFKPGSFSISPSMTAPNVSGRLLLNVLTYFSFTTLTSVGFGDVVPVVPVTRTLSWMEAVMGQFYLAVVVAGLVSMMPVKPTSVSRSQSDDRQADL